MIHAFSSFDLFVSSVTTPVFIDISISGNGLSIDQNLLRHPFISVTEDTCSYVFQHVWISVFMSFCFYGIPVCMSFCMSFCMSLFECFSVCILPVCSSAVFPFKCVSLFVCMSLCLYEYLSHRELSWENVWSMGVQWATVEPVITTIEL